MDFWTYSCVNCIRTLPYLRAWNARYADAGLVIVGVHTPEFAFEHVVGNVKRAVGEHDIRYPVAVDDDYGRGTPTANQYWPADYLIDRNGHIRDAHFGEGAYARDRGQDPHAARRARLGAARRAAGRDHRRRSRCRRRRPTSARSAARYSQKVHAGEDVRLHARRQAYLNEVAAQGHWRVESQKIVAGPGRAPAFRYIAPRIYVVAAPPAGGRGQHPGDHRRQGAAARSPCRTTTSTS